MKLRVLLADDHVLMRAGFRALLEKLGGIDVVAEADDGYAALRLIEKHMPDLVLMDITMPDLNGLEATARITKKFPNVRVIILSMHSSREYAQQAVRAGASGYLLKGADTTELQLALKAVSQGEIYLTPAVSKLVISDYAERIKNEGTTVERLTDRQREILQLIAEGYTRKQIATKLNISAKTYDTFRAQLLKQLDSRDNADLVHRAMEAGLISQNKENKL